MRTVFAVDMVLRGTEILGFTVISGVFDRSDFETAAVEPAFGRILGVTKARECRRALVSSIPIRVVAGVAPAVPFTPNFRFS